MTPAQCIKCGVPLESPTSEGTCLACRELPAAKKKGSPIVRILVFLVVLGIFGGGVGVWYLSETSDTFEVLFASWVESSLPADGIKVKAPAAMETKKDKAVLGEPRDGLWLTQGNGPTQIVYSVNCNIIPEGDLGKIIRSKLADEEIFKNTVSSLMKRDKIIRKVKVNNVDFFELETWNVDNFLVMRTGIVGNRMISYSVGGNHDINRNRSKISRFMNSIVFEEKK